MLSFQINKNFYFKNYDMLQKSNYAILKYIEKYKKIKKYSFFFEFENKF